MVFIPVLLYIYYFSLNILTDIFFDVVYFFFYIEFLTFMNQVICWPTLHTNKAQTCLFVMTYKQVGALLICSKFIMSRFIPNLYVRSPLCMKINKHQKNEFINKYQCFQGIHKVKYSESYYFIVIRHFWFDIIFLLNCS